MAVSLYQIVSTEDGIVEQRIEEIVGGGGDDGKHNCEKKVIILTWPGRTNDRDSLQDATLRDATIYLDNADKLAPHFTPRRILTFSNRKDLRVGDTKKIAALYPSTRVMSYRIRANHD